MSELTESTARQGDFALYAGALVMIAVASDQGVTITFPMTLGLHARDDFAHDYRGDGMIIARFVPFADVRALTDDELQTRLLVTMREHGPAYVRALTIGTADYVLANWA